MTNVSTKISKPSLGSEPSDEVSEKSNLVKEITLTQPDDWHIHLRDGISLSTTVPHAATSFNRVICMPNLVPPVTNASQALAYRQRIIEALQNADIPEVHKQSFDPRMTLYLTDTTTVEDIKLAAESGIVQGVKLYPAGATTNSAHGVTDLGGRNAIFETMQKYNLPLLIHGEATDSHIDIFDREKQFIDTTLNHIVRQFPELKIVVEHITTGDAADFVLSQNELVAATITPQHLLFNRNHLLVGGIKPHFYCLPILKRQQHQQVLLDVATSGNPKFFIGTDSAPHATDVKENACGCAGCYSASIALPLYATAFDNVGKLDRLEGFASHFGAAFYGLPINESTITLVNEPLNIPLSYPYMEQQSVTPLMAGETLPWSVKG